MTAERSTGETSEPGVSVEDERWGVKVKAVATLTGHPAPLTVLKFTNHSSSLVASGCRDGSVIIWDVQVYKRGWDEIGT